MDEIILKNVELRNFRCHEKYSLDCDKHTTLILGENGCGKTSVLEAIYIALRGRSFRATDKEIVKRGTDGYKIEVGFVDGRKEEVTFNGKKKQFLIKDKKTARLPSREKYPAVLFLPEDLHLIVSSPSSKRNYFDRFLGQIDEKYHVSLSRYNKVLKQRNELLKQDVVTADQLFSWDVLLAKYGVEIRQGRKALVEAVNSRFTEVYRSIAENEDYTSLEYKSYTAEVDESGYLRLLGIDFERDRMTGHTNFGVHKDDYEFVFNKAVADGSASRGEMRSVVLALKFIEAEMIEKTMVKKPVVLLDDVFSELDKTRQKCLVKNFKNNQVLLTSVEGVEL